MHAFLAGLAIGIFAGGFGGFTWGRSVEAKAQAVAAALKTSATTISSAVKK